jgi:hypothetical protein
MRNDSKEICNVNLQHSYKKEKNTPVHNLYFIILMTMDIVDSAIGIATHQALDGTGIESCCDTDFSRSFKPALGPTQCLSWG